MKMVSSERLHW